MVSVWPNFVSRKSIKEILLTPQEENMQNEQQQRLDHLREFCQQKNFPHKVHSLRHIFVDDKHRVLYCAIPKAGCSAWKWNLVVMNTNDTSLKVTKTVHDDGFLKA